MKDQANQLVTTISGPSPRRLLRTAWAGAVATVAAASLLFTASASVPASNVPDDDHDRPGQVQGTIESETVGQVQTVPDDANMLDSSIAVVTVQRAEPRPGPSQRESPALVGEPGRQEHQRFSLRESLLDVVTTFGGSTTGYANGRIPAGVLCPLEFAPGHMLRCDAAERLTALSDDFEREFGYPIPITDSYRTYVQQVALAGVKPHLAAIPGTSNHGWGLAVDLNDPIAGGASQEYVWLRVHGPDYGWDNPSWARRGGAKPEPWHFEFFAAGSVPDRATDPADVGRWGSTQPSGSSDSATPRDKPARDPEPKHGSTAGGIHEPPTKAVDEPSKRPPSPRPSEPDPKPTPSEPTPKPMTPTTSPAPSPTPAPAEPSQEPSATPSPTPPPAEPSPSPTPEPSPTTPPTPPPAEPSPTPTPEPTPSDDAEMPHAPTPSPRPSVSSGPLTSLVKGLGLAVGDTD